MLLLALRLLRAYLFECARGGADFVDGVARYHHHGGQGDAPAQDVGVVGVDVGLVGCGVGQRQVGDDARDDDDLCGGNDDDG